MDGGLGRLFIQVQANVLATQLRPAVGVWAFVFVFKTCWSVGKTSLRLRGLLMYQ